MPQCVWNEDDHSPTETTGGSLVSAIVTPLRASRISLEHSSSSSIIAISSLAVTGWSKVSALEASSISSSDAVSSGMVPVFSASEHKLFFFEWPANATADISTAWVRWLIPDWLKYVAYGSALIRVLKECRRGKSRRWRDPRYPQQQDDEPAAGSSLLHINNQYWINNLPRLWLFFPSLCQENRPDDIWKLLQTKYFDAHWLASK